MSAYTYSKWVLIIGGWIGLLLFLALYCGAQTLTGQIVGGPLLPQVVPSAAYPFQSSYPTYTQTPVASGANLQNAITAAACGTKLNLAHNGTFTTATAWTLPSNSCACHTDPSQWQIIQGDQFEVSYTPGVRTDPSAQYTQYPHLSSSDASYTFKVTANAVNCWAFAGLDITETTDGANAVISYGDGSFTQTNFPRDFGLWGSYIHGQPTKGITRGVMFNGIGARVVDNYISDIHKVGQDDQCFSEWDGYGQVLFQDNFCEAATENFSIAGSDPHTPGTVVADITFQKNHNFKSLSWRRSDPSYIGIHWDIKNIFELKGAQRLNINSNVFEYSWGDGQVGNLITINSDNQSGSNFYGWNSDITFFYNIVRHGTEVYQIGTNVPNLVYQSNSRFNFHDNLAYDIGSCAWGDSFGGAFPLVAIGGNQPGASFASSDMHFNHDTYASVGCISSGVNLQSSTGRFYYGFQDTNSIIDRAAYGAFRADGNGSSGDAAMPLYTPGGMANNNCIYGPSLGDTYNNAIFSGVKLVTAGVSGVFVNPGTDFHVLGVCKGAASDGLDIGACIDCVNAATSGVVKSLANPVTVTNVSPSTFTAAGGTSITITGTNFLAESALGVIVGGAGPTSTISTITCAVNTCTVAMSAPISLQVNDQICVNGGTIQDTGCISGSNSSALLVASVTDSMNFTYTDNGVGTRSWTGGTVNRISPGNACTSVVVVSPTSITCNTPAASGPVTTGQVNTFVCQFGICVGAGQAPTPVFETYN
jgi:IPT/TIG domain